MVVSSKRHPWVSADSATFLAFHSKSPGLSTGSLLDSIVTWRHESSQSVRSRLRVGLCRCARGSGREDRLPGKSRTSCSTPGTSIGANAEEAEGAQTKPDFIAKLAISRKESRESVYWLRVAIATSITTKDEVAWELDEASQLRAMITQAIRTAQSSSWRGGS
jgi:four helix bundle protein